ncbi:hypothetical protein HYT25_00265 [Candidatus Pacearchaeota archaeon]|nr:hypothetical protein [Candidatus Pacearchaeota archaeon]
MKLNYFLKESARDIVAFGSPVFFLLALARIAIIENYIYLGKVALAGILFLILMYSFKANIHLGFGMIILVFLSIYYNDLRFTIFASLIYIAAIFSLFYLKEEKSKIIKGIFLGLLSTGISWFAVEKLFQ